MSKNIVKLNDQYFSCSPITENFEDVKGTANLYSSGQKIENRKHVTKVSDNKKYKNKASKENLRKSSKKSSTKSLKKSSVKSPKKSSVKSPKKSSVKSPKKTRTRKGFCAGDTCLTEGDLKNIIDLLKQLELKK